MTSHSPASSPELPKPAVVSSQVDSTMRAMIVRSFSTDQMNAHYLKGYEAGSAAAAQAAKQVPGDWQPSAIAPQGLLDWLNRRRNESKSVCLIEPDDSVAQAWLDEFDRLLDERRPDSYSRNRINFTMTINWENDSPRQTIIVFRSVIKAVNARFEGVCYLAPAAPTGDQA